MLVSWSLRYWTKAECCGEPVSLVGPIVLLTNFTSDHMSSALGKSPIWNGSAALAGSTRRSASADSEAPDPTMNSRREIAIVSSAANDPLSWATLSPSDQIVVRRSQPTAVYGKRGVGRSSLMRQRQQLLLTAPSGQFSLFIEPAHHYPIEGIGLVDVAEVVGVWDLL